jgi:hypothetical protein
VADPTYVTRERLARALDVKASAYLRDALDGACRTGSRMVEGLLHRQTLYPVLKTRYVDFPSRQDAPNWRVYFDDDALISLTGATAGGSTIPTDQFFLAPDNAGPPYDYLELSRASSYAFTSSATTQRALAFTGLYGYRNDENTATTLTSALSATATALAVAAPAGGVGALLRIDSERIVVTEQGWASGGTIGSSPTASSSDVLLTVADTSVFKLGETLLVDAERLLVQDIVGSTTLMVRRAFDGTALAAHTSGATLYRHLAPVVYRGACGTTAATHASGATVYRWVCPPPAEELAQAYAEDAFLQGGSGYARTVGSGEAERQASGTGIRALEQRVMTTMGRMARTRAV